MNYEWVQICSSTYCHDLSSTLTQCVFACVCVYILSVTSGVISTAIIIHGRSAVKSWCLHSCMSRTKMQSSTFSNTRLLWAAVASYHHRGNKGIALLHECGQNGTVCVRVTLRTTCTTYLKTQQSTDRTNTASRHLSSILVWKHPGCSGEHKIKSEWKCLTQLSVCSPQGISVILAISCFEGELLYSQAETQMA